MDQEEASSLAHFELTAVELAGFGAASERVETIALKNISADSGVPYEVELSYHWRDEECEEIMVICRVTSKAWFRHHRFEQSITLCSGRR